MKKAGRFILCLLFCQSAGLLGSIFTFSAIPTWYALLNKPSFSPPNFVFGPVWLILYTLMGISLFLIWQKGLGRRDVKSAIIVFLFQLFLNSLWSIIFFGFKGIPGALLIIGLLWLMILLTIIKFYSLDRRAAYLLLPYLAWVGFAAILNFSIWSLNQ